MEELYYQCSESKGADQLRSYCTADLRLCFRICKKPVFSQRGSFQSSWNSSTFAVMSISQLPSFSGEDQKADFSFEV